RLGFKLLIPTDNDIFPLQMPVIFDLDQSELLPLHAPVPRAGIPSFSADGRVAFTIDRELWIVDGSGQPLETFPLGNYSNFAPLAPNGTKVAFNSRDDQIWLIDLATGVREKLTSDDSAYFNPVWSPDSMRLIVSTVSARLKSIDILTGRIYELDEGITPSWAPDSSTLFYSRTDRIDGVRLNHADIYYIQYDGTDKTLLTDQGGEYETAARISSDGSKIAFVSLKTGDLFQAPLIKNNIPRTNDGNSYTIGSPNKISGNAVSSAKLDQSLDRTQISTRPPSLLSTTLTTQVRLSGTVPYINQVYDTPDSFDGDWACGASSALMGINYFNILDYWDITCSLPYPHISHYGQYVSNIYTYNGVTYDIRAQDASHRWAYGGYGYIVQNDWEDTKGHMRDYINNHGLSSSVDWSPSWEKLQTEVDNGDPCVVLNSLTAAGHYIVTIGYYDNQYTAIFNDPYGNKNTPGYPSYDGADVMYDWPGYNNGFENLNTVHCFIYCRGNLPPTITQHPADQSVPWAGRVQLTVAATGKGTVTYQWQKDSSDLSNGNHYEDVTTPTLTVFNITDQQQGSYRCIVSNEYGSTNSNSATLTVTGPPVAPGDMDRDGDVDQEDFGHFQACLTGQSILQTDPDCQNALLDADNDVDQNDFGVFQLCMTGAKISADPYCAD
ncbi:MAG: immunoglobulin domain-containing protein, partial [Planctomycetota bacterium]